MIKFVHIPVGRLALLVRAAHSDMYFVYILKSLKDSKLYVGYSHNPRERLEYHNQGKVEATKHRRTFEIIFIEWGRTHLKKVLSNYLKQVKIDTS